jgi:hypothetical protein
MRAVVTRCTAPEVTSMQGSAFYPKEPIRPAILLDQARLARVLSRSGGYYLHAAPYSVADAPILALAYERFAAGPA